MEKNEQMKTVLGIALLYTIITGAFSFINRLMFDANLRIFLNRDALWLVTVAVIIFILITNIKKLNQGIYFNVLNDSTTRVAAGILVILEAIIVLSSSLPMWTISMISVIKSSKMVQQNDTMTIIIVLFTNIIQIVILLCQIFVGVYLLKFYKSKTKGADIPSNV